MVLENQVAIVTGGGQGIGKAIAVRCASEGANIAVFDVNADEFERLDVLVNNAGIEKRAEFLEITPEDWQRQLDVNLSGTFYCTQAAARENEQTSLWTDRERVAVPAKRDSGAPHRRIPAEGEGKIVKFRASFSED